MRTDLPVPVYQVITQTDFETLNFNVLGRQPDTPSFRYFEVAGAAHNVVHKDIELVPAGLLGPDALGLADLCASEMNSTADGPVFASYVLNALWASMETHADFRSYYRIVDRRLPAGQVMEEVDGVLLRDALGNVIGGVRLPALEAPTATYLSTNTASPDLPPALLAIGNLACRLSGSVVPFDQATLDALYPTPAFAHGNIGWAYYQVKNFDAARRHLEMSVFLNPRFCLGFSNLGLLYRDTGNSRGAREAFEKATRTCPTFAEPWYHLGVMLQESGDAAGAEEAFRKCAEAAPETAIGRRCAARR